MFHRGARIFVRRHPQIVRTRQRLSVELGEPHKEIQAMFGMWGHHWTRAHHDRAIELGKTLLARAEELGEPVALSVGNRSLGSTLFTLGDFVQRARTPRTGRRTRAASGQRGTAPIIRGRPADRRQLILGWDLWNLGYPEQAHATCPKRSKGDRAADPTPSPSPNMRRAQCNCCVARSKTRWSMRIGVLALSREHRINLYALYSRFGRGYALAKMGQHGEEAISEMRAAIAEARAQPARPTCEASCSHRSPAAQEQTQETRGAALATVEGALQQISDVSGRAWEAELRRLRGACLLAAHPEAAKEAERSYREAIAVARTSRPARWSCAPPRRWRGCCSSQGRRAGGACAARRDVRLVHRGLRHRRA